MRRPWAVRFFAFATCPTPLRQGGASLPLRLRSYTAVLQIPLYTKTARREYLSSNLRNIPLGQSRAIPATWRFPPVGCLFTSQVTVCAIVKNVADVILNRGVATHMPLHNVCAESIFPQTCEISRLGKVVRYPRRGVFPPSVACLLHRSPFAQ